MTNREKYKKAFSAVHPSNEFYLEVEKMKKVRKQYVYKKMAASILCCVIFMASAKVAYAMDVGGIQRMVQLWIQGECTNVTVQFDGDGTYSMEYTDADGKEQFRGGGGVEFAPDGSAIPISEEEIMESLTMPDVEYMDDGSVWVYWFDQKVDITHKFVDGVCYVEFVKGKETMYVTVKFRGGFAASPHKYVDPDSWESN